MGVFFNLNLSLTRIENTFDTHYCIMKKVVGFLLLACAFSLTQAQDSVIVSKSKKKDWSKVNLNGRPKDHFLIQMGYNSWTKKPDTLQTKGLPLSFNFYFMLDFPFKSDPRWSAAIGAGFGIDNQKFENTSIDLAGLKSSTELHFNNVKDTTHFKKYKLTNTYLEAPVELRFSSNPEDNMHSWKGAIGVKVGTMISATTRGKTLLNGSGGTINNYVEKQKSKRFFNGTRLSVMGRFGYGIVSVYAAYQFNPFIKDGVGPDVRPLQVGITISGL